MPTWQMKYNANRRDIARLYDGCDMVIVKIPEGYHRVCSGAASGGDLSFWPEVREFRPRSGGMDMGTTMPAAGYLCLIRKEKPDV